MGRSRYLVGMLLVGLVSLIGCAEGVSKNQSPIATEEERTIADQVTTEKIANLHASEEQVLRKQWTRGR